MKAVGVKMYEFHWFHLPMQYSVAGDHNFPDLIALLECMSIVAVALLHLQEKCFPNVECLT